MTDLVAAIRAAIDETERIAHRFHRNDCDGLMGVGGGTGTCDCGEPDRRRCRCAADRKILDLHRSYDEEYPDHADPDHPERQCVGCGFDGQEEVRVADVNRCPVVGALAEAYGVEA